MCARELIVAYVNNEEKILITIHICNEFNPVWIEMSKKKKAGVQVDKADFVLTTIKINTKKVYFNSSKFFFLCHFVHASLKKNKRCFQTPKDSKSTLSLATPTLHHVEF